MTDMKKRIILILDSEKNVAQSELKGVFEN